MAYELPLQPAYSPAAYPATREQLVLPLAMQSDEAVTHLLKSMPARHVNKTGDAERESLYDSLELSDMRQILTEATAWAPEEYDALKIEVALGIARKVNSALWYNGADPADESMPPSLDLLEDDQVTDCYGYTLLTSRCLEMAGVEHMIGWVNGHAHIVLPVIEDEHDSAWFIDPLTPGLSGSLSGIVSEQELEGVQTQIGVFGRAAVHVRAEGFKDSGDTRSSFSRLAYENPWMEHPQASGTTPQPELVMSIFASTDGQRLLNLHRSYKRAIVQENLGEAAECLAAMRGMYPEIDSRNVAHLQQVEELVRQLSLDGDLLRANHVIASYFTDMVPTDDPEVASCRTACFEMVRDARHQLAAVRK